MAYSRSSGTTRSSFCPEEMTSGTAAAKIRMAMMIVASGSQRYQGFHRVIAVESMTAKDPPASAATCKKIPCMLSLWSCE